jgi:hypothetical protein
MPSKIGQHGTLQVFIFKEYSAPGMIFAPIGQIGSEWIRVIEAAIGILIERRIGIGWTFFIGR